MGDAGMPHSLQDSLDNTKVSYAQLGASGLKVSIPVLGAMSFGMFDLAPFAQASESLSILSSEHHSLQKTGLM